METWVEFPSLRAFLRAFERPVCTIFKAPYSHFYPWAEFWTFDHLIGLLGLQACNRQADNCIRLTSSRAFFRVFERPVCTIFKDPYSHFYTWAEFWISDHLIWLLELQACDRQADTCIRFTSSRGFFRAFERPVCTIFKITYSHFYTWAKFWASDYLIKLLKLQACYWQADTCVRFPSSRALFRVFERPVCTIFKSSFLHFYTWVEFWTSDYLRELLRLQGCDRQADTRVRFPSSRPFFRDFKRRICTIFKASFLHLYTWAEF